jgi:tetratricopeptide (TPR) repeat protein
MKKMMFFLVPAISLLLLHQSTIVSAQDLQSTIKLTRSEQFRKAGQSFQSLVKRDPSNANVYFYYGENFLQKYFSDTLTYSFAEISDSAIRLFHVGIEKQQDNPLNYVGLGEIELIRKNKVSAQVYFDQALSLLPSKSNKQSSLSKKDQAVVLIKMANAFVKARVNDTSRILSFLKNAEQLDNKNFDLFIVKGDVYMLLLADGSTAIGYYNKAQSLNPQSPRAKLRLGQLWAKTNNYTSALNYYNEVIKIDSNYAPVYWEMGYLLSKTGQDVKAKESFEKFLSLSASSKMARIQYVNILLDLQDYREAIHQINLVMVNDSSNNDFNRALGYAYYETGQYEKGLYYMTKFFDNTVDSKTRTLDFVYYGKLLAKNNKDSLAGELLMKAFQMDTTQPELLNQAISAYLKLKNYTMASEIVIRKIMIKKDVANDYYILGKLYYNLHEWQKADSVFSINISLDPSNIKGYLWKAWSLVNQDPDSKEGLAKIAFENLIDKAKSDSIKNNQELKQAYSYLAYYYFLQYVKTKSQSDAITSKNYCEKVLGIEPTDEKAKTMLKELKTRIK